MIELIFRCKTTLSLYSAQMSFLTPVFLLYLLFAFQPVFAQNAESLCEKAYSACKSIKSANGEISSRITSGLSEIRSSIKTEEFQSRFRFTLNPASTFSLYQFYSETWQKGKRIGGVYFGEGHQIRFMETDSQITDQSLKGRQTKPILEPHQIFIPLLQSADFFLLPQDRMEAGIIYLEKGPDTVVNAIPCHMLIMQRDLSTSEKVLPPHSFRIMLRKSDGLPIAYQMNWQIGDEENRFFYQGWFNLTNVEIIDKTMIIDSSLLPGWVQKKLKKSGTKHK